MPLPDLARNGAMGLTPRRTEPAGIAGMSEPEETNLNWDLPKLVDILGVLANAPRPPSADHARRSFLRFPVRTAPKLTMFGTTLALEMLGICLMAFELSIG